MIDDQGNVYYYLNDHLGSAAVVINSSGTVRDKHKYQAFGGSDGSSAVLGQAYRYTGKPLDEELDLDWYYYGARYYDPSIGRFLRVDPLHGNNLSWSPYVYCLDNPLILIDLNGLDESLTLRGRVLIPGMLGAAPGVVALNHFDAGVSRSKGYAIRAGAYEAGARVSLNVGTEGADLTAKAGVKTGGILDLGFETKISTDATFVAKAGGEINIGSLAGKGQVGLNADLTTGDVTPVSEVETSSTVPGGIPGSKQTSTANKQGVVYEIVVGSTGLKVTYYPKGKQDLSNKPGAEDKPSNTGKVD